MKLKRKTVVMAWILGAAVVCFLLVASSLARPTPLAPTSRVAIAVPELTEASGLAVSRRTADVFWSLNDSGGQPVLYGFGADGAPRGKLRLLRAKNGDWEALTAFEFNGRSWLAVGDIGDNGRRRGSVQIHVIEEPAPNQLSTTRETAVEIAWTVSFRYEDGPRDCESLVADPRLQQFMLVTKFTRAHDAYAVPLRPPESAGIVTAKRIASLNRLPRPSALQRIFPSPTGRYRGEPTDACLAADGKTLAVLTYSEVLVYRRGPGEAWESVFAREPEHFAEHGLPQAEALSFTPDGQVLFVTGEQRRPLLLRFDAK